MAALQNTVHSDPRYMHAWAGYTPGIGEQELGSPVNVGAGFWYDNQSTKARIKGYVDNQRLMNVDQHYSLFAKDAQGDAPNETDWIPVDFPGMLARLMRHYSLGPEFGVEAKVSGTDPEIQRIFEQGNVTERLRQCSEAFPSLGDAVLRIDVEDREDDEGELIPTAVPKFIHPGCYHPTFDPLDATRVESVTLAYVYPIPEGDRRDPKYPFMVLKEIHTLRDGVSGAESNVVPISGARRSRKPKKEGFVEYQLVEWTGCEEGNELKVGDFFPGVEDAPTGIDEIPIIHMPYNAPGGSPWGRSEFDRIMRIVLAIENRLTQEDEILERHARPKLIVGPGVLDNEGRANLADFDVIEIDPSVLEKAVKPEYLTWDPKIEAVKHQIESLLDFFFISTETCPASFGMERSGSQVESARALRFKAHRTINKVEDLRDTLKHAIMKLFRVGQKMELAVREEEGMESYERSAITINFPDPIIEDHTQDAQDYGALKANGLVSTRRAVGDLFNLTPDEVEAELEAIKEDQKTSTWLPDRVSDNPELGATGDKLDAETDAAGNPKPGAPPFGAKPKGVPPGAKPADAPLPKK